MKPLAIDLYCGLGGWTDGLLAEGWEVIGFDIERHEYGELRYPGQLIVQDVRTIDGARFADASLIVGSSPCQEFSYRAMPWSRARSLPPPYLGMELFEAQFRIQREACAAAGRYIPMVVENVRGAQKWVGRSRWNYGSYHLWGDVPALMPVARRDVVKVGGLDWNGFKKGDPNYKGQAFNTITTTRELAGIKNQGGSWFNVAHNTTSGKGRNPHGRPYPTPHLTNPDERGVKCGGDWFHPDDCSPMRNHSSKSSSRKRATAMISKIPLPLARHIGRVFYPREVAA